MRILLINDFQEAGGAEIVLHNMKVSLRMLGHTVETFYGKKNPDQLSAPLDYIYNFKTAKALDSLLHKNQYSLVIVFNYASVLSPSILQILLKHKKRQGFRVYYNSHDAHLICPNSGLNYFEKGEPKVFEEYSSASSFVWKKVDHRGGIYSWVKKIQWLIAYRVLNLYRVFDKVISPGFFLLERIRRFYPSMEGIILRNPCLELSGAEKYSEKFLKSSSHPESFLTSAHGVHRDHPMRLLFIGRLSHEKGIIPFLKAFSGIQRECYLDIFGSGSLERDITDEISRLGLDAKVSIKGKRSHDEIMNLMSAYDALVLPSVGAEFAPLSIVEAAAKGLFVLTMSQGGMKEMAEEVGNYIFIDPLSTNSIDNALEYIACHTFKPTDLRDYTIRTYTENLEKKLLS